MSKTPVFCFVLAASLPLPGGTFDVKTFGPRGDGKSADREAINKAIEAAAAAGGGTVHFPTGTYVTGEMHGAPHRADPGSTPSSAQR